MALSAACTSTPDAGSAEDEVSAIRQAQMATRVFRKLIGRDPTPAELQQLREATLGQMVDTVLALPDFQADGFFGFQRDRLLLHRDGDEKWMRASLNDYCALRLDMKDVAAADRDGAGYYEILRYRDRWVPITQSAIGLPLQCANVPVTELKKAIDGAAGSPDAQVCAQQVKNREPLLTETRALDASNDARPFFATEPARKFLAEAMKTRLFRASPAAGSPPPEGDFEIPVDANGMPSLRAFDGQPTDRCTTVDALGASAPVIVPTQGAALYLKVRVPAAIEGVHGSMYWLSRHPSTQKNRDLHRARLLFFSYMCTEISPAMAAATGGDPEELEPLKPYFDPNDQHVRTAANCYNCHTQVQPVANYFGEMTKGAPYSGEGSGFALTSYYQQNDGFRRPGGLWKGESFHEPGAGKFGMEGLAEMLSSLDSSHDCIARNTWSSLIGSGHPMTDAELGAAVKAFKGDGTFRFQNLLRHLMVESERGKSFFEGGEAALEEKKPIKDVDCRDVASVPAEAASAHETFLVGSCSGCHTQNPTRGFWEKDPADPTKKLWKPERLVGPGLRYQDAAQLYDNAYCRVWNGSMPIGGWNDEGGMTGDAKRKQALCFFAGKRNEAAKASSDPAIRALDSRPCEGQVVAPDGLPHLIEP